MATASKRSRKRKTTREQRAVLYVDDEDNARKYFERTLSRRFPVIAVPSVAAAREVLSTRGGEISVAVVDQRMPDEMGISLLVRLCREWPAIVRVVTTGYTDFATTVRAINEGHVYAYIEKPWNVDELIAMVEDAVAHSEASRTGPSRRRKPVAAETVSAPATEPEGPSHLSAFGHLLDVWCRGAEEALSEFLQATGSSDRAKTEAAGEPPPGARVLRHVFEQLGMPRPALDDAVDPAEMVQHAVLLGQGVVQGGSGSVQGRAPHDLPLVRGNRSLLRVLFEVLLREMFRWQGASPAIRVSAAVTSLRDAPAVQVVFRGGTRPWDPGLAALAGASRGRSPGDLGADLLAGFLIAHHHRGRLLILRERPVGPGFELTLPVAPG